MAKIESLFLTEAEIAARVGVSLSDWQIAAAGLEKRGLPYQNPIFNNRRYWPAIRAFLDRWEGVDPHSGREGDFAPRRGEPAWKIKPGAPI